MTAALAATPPMTLRTLDALLCSPEAVAARHRFLRWAARNRITDAEDAIQHTLTAWYERIAPDLEPVSELPFALFWACAAREAIRLHRGRNRVRDLPPDVADRRHDEPPAATRLAVLALLDAAVGRLPDVDEALIRGRYWERLTAAELGDLYARSANWVNKRIAAVRTRLGLTLLAAIRDGGIDPADLPPEIRAFFPGE